ncbi:MAG: hypothetical protein ACXVAX_06225 [Pseudobdellovibrio sp.]
MTRTENARAVFFVGGLSILILLLCWIFLDKNRANDDFAKAAFVAAIFFNYPHFMASYFLIYSDFRKQIKTGWRYQWAAVGVPVILTAAFSAIILFERGDWFVQIVNLMFFLLGWHLIKQTFGVIIVLSALKKFFYTPTEKRFILANLFSVWAIGFTNSQLGSLSILFYGLKVPASNLDEIWLKLSYAVFFISFVAVIVVHILKFRRENKFPLLASAAALLATYTWFIPNLIEPHFLYLVTAFHAMQYLFFVFLFKQNQIRDGLSRVAIGDLKAQLKSKVLIYFSLIFVSGIIVLHLIPNSLDSAYKFGNAAMGTNVFMATFFVFINIHHYYIDNVIWRSSNADMRKYLFLTEHH